MTSACTIPNLDTVRYSSPVPIIGLYIAAGSLVCFLLMLFDIISAYRRSRSWIPCRFFSLNSFSLTLLAIATKLQVDLTTPMPGVPDQLLKLTGTALLCICMGFLNLSVGNNGNSEYLSNMAALTIMIITIVVNICIQISTGVIHLFITEHIIIMCCMLGVLPLMWYCAQETELQNRVDIDSVRYNMADNQSKLGNVGLLGRLKACYAIGFDKHPQLRACRALGNLIMLPFCMVCCCVLVEAIVRSVVVKQLRFCRGASDYAWSTWFILITQNLTVLLGCFAILSRWFTSFSFVSFELLFDCIDDNDDSMKKKFTAIFGSPSCYKLGIYLQTSLQFVVAFLWLLVLWLPFHLFPIFGGKLHEEEVLSKSVKEFISRIHGSVSDSICDMYPCNWTMEKALNDIAKCLKESMSSSPKELRGLLLRVRPSPELLHLAPSDNVLSPLPLAVLVKIAIKCLPEAETEALVLCFHEAIDILQPFIDQRHRVFMRNPLKVDEDFDKCLRLYNYLDFDNYRYGSLLDVDQNYSRRVRHIVPVIQEILNRGRSRRMNLYDVIERLFVERLHLSFAELPNVIFKLAMECPMDEYKERVRPALVALRKIVPLEGYIEWSFPKESGISSWKSLEIRAADNRNNRTERNSDTNTSLPPRIDKTAGVDITSRSINDPVTLEIEEL